MTPVRGVVFLNSHRRLWRYAVWPIASNVVLTLGIIAGAMWLLYAVHPIWSPTFATQWLNTIIESIVLIVSILIILIVGAIVWLLLGGVLLGHFHGILAEKVERAIGIDESLLKSVPIMYDVIDTLRGLAMTIFALMLSFIPIVGPPLAYYNEAMVFGLDTLDHPMALRGKRRVDKLKFIRRHRLHTLGLGTVVFLFFLIPIIGAVFVTTAVTGAVLLHRDLEAHGKTVGHYQPTVES